MTDLLPITPEETDEEYEKIVKQRSEKKPGSSGTYKRKKEERFGGVEKEKFLTDSAWKKLAEPLYSKGSTIAEFSSVRWHGTSAIRFLIENSPVWITIYAGNFKKPENRSYGIFISYSGFFDERDKTKKIKVNNMQTIDAIKSRIKDNRQNLGECFDKYGSVFVGDKEAKEATIADTTLSQDGGYTSDENAINKLAELLDLYVEHIVPLIKAANSK